MKVLVIGSSAREHAIVWKLLQSTQTLDVLCAPGNAGIAECAECLNVADTDIDRLLELIIVRRINLVIVSSPEAIALGMVDRFRKEGINVFGPTKAAAEIEKSRYFAKEFMLDHDIPGPKYASFDQKEMAIAYAQTLELPVLIKSDNRRPDGSDVTIAQNHQDIFIAIDRYFAGETFGCESRVVIEEYLEGQDASVYAICDGNMGLSLLPAQDHNKAEDGDIGLNTEGMGAYAPTPIVSSEIMHKIRHKIIDPTMNGLRMMGRPYTGVLSFDLIIKDDEPYLLEYNTSFGDPEAQVILPLFDEDLFEVCMASAREDLSAFQEGFHKFLGAALAVTLASSGYPARSETGKLIDFSGLNQKDPSLSGSPGDLEQVLKAKALIFHGATKKIGDEFVSDGGRVISATAVAESLVDAQVLAYKLADKIHFDGKQYRRDIGDKGMV